MSAINFPGMVVDLFAGGGGASTGIEAALGRPVDLAVNHSAVAIAVHAANHPTTRHLVTDVFEVDPREATGGRPVSLLWASPDCTHFSVAKGGKPRSRKIRSLAHVVVDWARAVRPAVILLENVPEFRTWGPLHTEGDEKGRPIKERAGETFDAWRGALELLGYSVEWRILDSSHFGAPTRRRRLFLVARCDGEPIRWPEPTHGPGLLPLHTAAECIDWSIPCPSIFDRAKPLADKTLWRVAQGIRKFVFENPAPFIVQVNHGGWEARTEPITAPLSTVTAARRGHAVVAPTLAPFVAGCGGRAGDSGPTAGDAPVGTITAKNDRVLVAPTLVQTGYGERPGQRPRHLDLHAPLGTVVAGGSKHALVSAFLAKHYGDPGRTSGGGVVVGQGLAQPIGTITAKDHHSLAAVTLATFRGTHPSQPGSAPVDAPMLTVTAGGTHVAAVCAFLVAHGANSDARVMVDGVEHVIADIGLRMLEPHELLRAQFGRFAEGYDLSAAPSKAAKVRLIGNSVAPEVAEALVRANLTSTTSRRAA